MVYLFAEEILNIEEVFFLFFSNNIDIYYRKVLALILSLSTIAPKTFLVVLVFFLDLVGKKLLFLIRCISKENISRLIFSMRGST